MNVTIQQLRQVFPHAPGHLADHVGPLNRAFEKAACNTPQRIAAAIGQIGVETGELQFMRELADGREYEGRHDLGNYTPGDGVRYKGRGYIGLTGFTNYEEFSLWLGTDVVNKPELVTTNLDIAGESFAWYWITRNLNRYADQADVHTASRVVNGGLNGVEGRVRYTAAMLDILLAAEAEA